jgi:hypothetical protein
MIDGIIKITAATGDRLVKLASYLAPDAEETAHLEAYRWIKQLRQAKVDGRGMRQRFTVRGDSLWWFTEIYLHKQRAALVILAALAATRTLIEREEPQTIAVADGSVIVRHVVPLAAGRFGVVGQGSVADHEWSTRLRGLKRRAHTLTLAALASRLRIGTLEPTQSPRVAAFIHRAFWRSGGDEGSAEAYIGPVVKEIEASGGPDSVKYVGVGPAVNFRARRWWTPLGTAPTTVVPVERYAPWSALRDSRQVWRDRRDNFRALSASEDLRRAAVIGDVDCWPIVREQLAGVAYLQWPWSARAMDEAAAALDTLRPAIALTYAEAGGWGRALILDARRRGIPTAGLQHGFIYRHWLNYRHEPDEMQPDSRGDSGFPAPALTVVFDEYAAQHLRTAGHFRTESIAVCGSPRLDALVRDLSRVSAGEISRVREITGVSESEMIVLVAAKEREAGKALRELVAAVSTQRGVRIVIKPHPAETPAAYDSIASGVPFVRVLPSDTPLAPLLAVSRAIVTVNSTVAIDAAIAGVPALVIGLPNNLSPFVDAGAFAGATSAHEIGDQLQRVLYDEGFRQRLASSRAKLLGGYAMKSDGLSAERSAQAVLSITSARSN